MALKPCRECTAKISSKAKTCPHCGVKNPAGSNAGAWGVVFIVILLVVIAEGAEKPGTPPIDPAAQAASEKANENYESAEGSFFGCAQYHAKNERLPVYDARTITNSVITIRIECQDTYSPAFEACQKTGKPKNDCEAALDKTAFTAIYHAE